MIYQKTSKNTRSTVIVYGLLNLQIPSHAPIFVAFSMHFIQHVVSRDSERERRRRLDVLSFFNFFILYHGSLTKDAL